MRTIKFRGQRIDTSVWVYGHYFTSPLTDENSGTKPDAGWFFLTGETRHCISQDGVAFVVKPETIGQFIEQNDELGKEVYEGDVLHNQRNNRVFNWLIEIIHGHPMLINIGIDGYRHKPLMLEKDSSASRIIIGNIHNNPELLK